jgi:hypothetical protein
VRFVITVMVRDEIDVIAAWVEHHAAQGADLIIATDNGSVDGTTDVLKAYADLGIVELHHDPVHRKQQHALVTKMARRAKTEHAADWVINADADEFWVPVDKSLTLRSALEAIPLSLNAFTVPVVNLLGPPARRGSGIDRLLWRDCRTNEQLREIGIYAQPADNSVHRGDADIEVAQGNHFVSVKSNGQPDPAFALEMFHLPWRSWEQLQRKVVQTGQAYEANPDLRPSKNHHVMNDYRRYLAGRLWYAFLLRQPSKRSSSRPSRRGRWCAIRGYVTTSTAFGPPRASRHFSTRCSTRQTTNPSIRRSTGQVQRWARCSTRWNVSAASSRRGTAATGRCRHRRQGVGTDHCDVAVRLPQWTAFVRRKLGDSRRADPRTEANWSNPPQFK